MKRNETDHPHQAGTPATSAARWLSGARVMWRSGNQSGTALSLDGSRILGQRVPRLADTAGRYVPRLSAVLTLCPQAVCCVDVMSPGCLLC